MIECVPTQHITNLLDTFSGNLVSLSHHPFGCRVMQRILEHCSDQARYDTFMAEILKVRGEEPQGLLHKACKATLGLLHKACTDALQHCAAEPCHMPSQCAARRVLLA